MKKVLLVQVSKVDRGLLNTLSSFLTSSGFDVKVHPEIFHVTVTSYEWDKSGFNSSSLIESFSKRFLSYPFDFILGISSVPTTTSNVLETKDKLALLFVRNFEDASADKTLERLKKVSLYAIGKIAGLGECKNYCVMRGFKDLKELDLLPSTYCKECKKKLDIDDKS